MIIKRSESSSPQGLRYLRRVTQEASQGNDRDASGLPLIGEKRKSMEGAGGGNQQQLTAWRAIAERIAM